MWFQSYQPVIRLHDKNVEGTHIFITDFSFQ